MASSLLLLLDDIASILDDVAMMSKMAAKKTTGVLGDDLALNAQQVTGVRAERELPIVWSVAKGSMLNKVILVPLALLISAFIPWLINPLLVIGGLFLCYEGSEKVIHTLLHKKHAAADDRYEAAAQHFAQSEEELRIFEQEKIKGAVRTDFILSAEIVVITLGTVATASFSTRLTVLCLIAVLMTIGVYGLVAMIVKIDDLGLYLTQQASQAKQKIGQGLLAFAPVLMKTLSIVGTVAMFLVGGGIIAHAVPFIHHLTQEAANSAELLPAVGSIVGAIAPTLLNLVLGVVAGIVVLAAITVITKIKAKSA